MGFLQLLPQHGFRRDPDREGPCLHRCLESGGVDLDTCNGCLKAVLDWFGEPDMKVCTEHNRQGKYFNIHHFLNSQSMFIAYLKHRSGEFIAPAHAHGNYS
jgi:hypothetical protein